MYTGVERRKTHIRVLRKIGPLFEPKAYKDAKDPCPVFDGKHWHIFGSGGDVRSERWRILHARAEHLEGPWEDLPAAQLVGLAGDRVAAPGVVYVPDERCFHMFVQTDFMTSESHIHHLVSEDGATFIGKDWALTSDPEHNEIGLYDPHPSFLHGRYLLVYAATTPGENVFRPRPDIFLAEADSWHGSWRRLGKILDHEAIAEHHNRKDDPAYEWGIEGPQLLQLPNGKILLNATCFMPGGRFGTRQRVFFAVADDVLGPYETFGPVLKSQLAPWESGENGHAAGFAGERSITLFYQARSLENENATENPWRYGIAEFDMQTF